jgi:hypothetical protein
MKRVFYLMIFIFAFITSYSQEKSIELSHYIFPEFTQGVVLMKTGIQSNALLNYNTLSEEMIFEHEGKKLAIAKEEMELVDTIFIKGRKFFELNNIFVELINHSIFDLYAEHKCELNFLGKPAAYGGTSQTSASNSAAFFYSGGSFYELKLPEHYETNPYTYYWLKKNGDLKRFINMTQLMKLFKNKKELFKTYVKMHIVKYENEEGIIQLINYMESN